MIDERIKWLGSLKVGDEVALGTDWNGNTIAVIERMTPTQIVIGRYRYRRDNGRLIGQAGYKIGYLQPVTDEVRRGVLARDLSYNIRCGALHKLPLDKLRGIEALMKPDTDRSEQSNV